MRKKLRQAFIEYILIIVSYYFSGWLRFYLPTKWAMPFSMVDLRTFLPLAIGCGAISVILYLAMDDYRSVHYKNVYVEASWVLFVQTLSGLICSAILFWVQGSQMSRVFLVIFVGTSFVFVMLKRLILHRAHKKDLKHDNGTYRILMIGGGDVARRFYRCINEEVINRRYSMEGYVAPSENPAIPEYLGKPEELYDLLGERKVDRVVVVEEEGTPNMRTILSICNLYGIPVEIIPAFNDYMISGRESLYGDLHLFSVNINNTDNILGVNIAVTSMDRTIAQIRENLEEWRGKYICVSNVHTTVMAHDDKDYRKVQNDAVMSLPDGGPLSSHSRSTGNEDAARVTGPDLMQQVLKASGEYGWKHFFYGSTQETLDILKNVLAEKYPGAEVVGMISPPFRELTPEEDAEYIKRINEAKPDFVWVGLGAPKQEIWMAAHQDRIQALMIGVGAAFDYESGNIRRAPKWMQKCNLEWLYRLMQDPKRLFKRYFVTNIKYLWLTRR